MSDLIFRCKDSYPYKLALIVGENECKLQSIINDLKGTVATVDIGQELSEHYMYERLKFSGIITENWIRKRIENEQNDIFFIHTEMLFTKSMGLDVIKLLKSCSRNRIVIANVPGRVEKEKLYIGEECVEDYKVYNISDIKEIIKI